jgi:CO/xanthine dehydrogenase Mo-binding subunit
MIPLKSVGHETPRIDALQRVTGAATYTGDVHLPGMLYARVRRCPHAHARIRRVDVSKALALAGVKAAITRDNCSVIWSSGDTRNQRYLFNNPARFAGDAVAAVNRHVAEDAIHLIEVEYEGAAQAQRGGDPTGWEPLAQRKRRPRTGDVSQGQRGGSAAHGGSRF